MFEVGTNSYVSITEVRDYLTDRGQDLTSVEDSKIEIFLIQATDFFETRYHNLKSCKELETQNLSFPRKLWEGIPTEVKKTIYGFCKVLLLGGELTVHNPNEIVKRKLEKVGPITEDTEYDNTFFSVYGFYPVEDTLMKPFLINGSLQGSTGTRTIR